MKIFNPDRIRPSRIDRVAALAMIAVLSLGCGGVISGQESAPDGNDDPLCSFDAGDYMTVGSELCTSGEFDCGPEGFTPGRTSPDNPLPVVSSWMSDTFALRIPSERCEELQAKLN
jgi:hypothetical protein